MSRNACARPFAEFSGTAVTRVVCLGLAAALVAIAAPDVVAQNLVQNPGFDDHVTPEWTIAQGDATWSSEDAAGSPSSGSAELTNTSSGVSGSEMIHQCVPVEAETDYIVSLDGYQPSGQGTTGHMNFIIYVYEDPSCSGGPIASAAASLTSGDLDAWTSMQTVLQVPASVASLGADFRILTSKTDGGIDFTVRADNASVTSATVFHDDFESGTLAAWSNVVP